PMSETVSRFAIQARSALLIEQAETDPRLNSRLQKLVGDRSHICVPLFAGDRPVGAVSVMSTSEHERLNEEDRQTLELLAGVLSEGVSRAAESEAKRKQLDALARFEAIYQGALSGVLVISVDGQVIDANPAMVDLLGFDSAEHIEREFAHYLHPEDRETIIT